MTNHGKTCWCSTYLSFQKFFNSSIVLVAPRILANNTSTPPSPKPQKELQKSSDWFRKIGELCLAYLARDVVEGCLLADIDIVIIWVKWQKKKGGGR